MLKRLFAAVLVVAIASPAFAQVELSQVPPVAPAPVPPSSGLSIEVTSNEIVTKVETIEVTTETFNGVTKETNRRTIGENSTTTTATVLTTDADVETFTVFNAGFTVVTTTQIEPGVYTVAAPPGRYLAYAERSTGQNKIKLFVIEGPPEPPTPDVPVSAIAERAAALADAVNDPATRKDLADTLAGLDLSAATSYPEAAATVNRAIEGPGGVLARRRGVSLKRDWLDGFRRPMQAAVIEAGAAGLPEYLTAIEAIVEGLRRPAAMVRKFPPVEYVTPRRY